MTRLSLTFECQGATLAGTLDTAPGKTGLLIVTGGNEVRAGAFSGQSKLASAVSSAGFPVFRFDRRGIGDSDGENRGFRKAEKDILAAVEAFRAMCPQMDRVVAFGNCDAASALMLTNGRQCDALILANPWTIEDSQDGIAPEVARSRYAEKLKSPAELLRLLSGKVSLRKLVAGLKQAVKPSTPPSSLASEMRLGLDAFGKPAIILLAGADRTAQTFAANWTTDTYEIRHCEKAGHAFVEPHADEWLRAQILQMLRA